MRRLPAAALWLLLAGCAGAAARGAVPACTGDDQCGPGQMCLAEGCVSPGTVVVEVSGDSRSGQYAQEFSLNATDLGAGIGFDLGSPLKLAGELDRERSPVVDPTNRIVYADPVVLQAFGESQLLPGVKRTYEMRFDTTDHGRYSMAVGAGEFSVIATPVDNSVPPMVQAGVAISRAALTPSVNFAFPSADGVVHLQGQLLKRLLPAPGVVVSTPLDVQVFDNETHQPLSQRAPVSTTLGTFSLTLNPAAKSLTSVMMVASPREAGALVPTKTFTLTTPFSPYVTLELGDFGDPLPNAGAVVVASDGSPIQGAQVIVQGPTIGGGTFTSKIATTDATGAFGVDVLPSPSSGSLTLTVVPPPDSNAALWQGQVKTLLRGATPALVAADRPSDPLPFTIHCQDRITASGSVLTPAGQPATGLRVRAAEQSNSDRPIALNDVEALTDASGRFSLKLDVGTWRLDFYPGSALPQTSRAWVVRGVDDNGLTTTSLEFQPLTLPRGLMVSGTVVATVGTVPGQPAPFASLRFFRTGLDPNGKPVSFLLGTTLADERGAYQAMLPIVQSSAH